MKKILTLALSLSLFFTSVLYADSVRISQVDSSTLLLNQQVRLYVSVTDDEGVPIPSLKQENFRISESVEGKSPNPIPNITQFRTGTNYEEGIQFLLLLDNSGSMYRNLQGKKPQGEESDRITQAKAAVRSFLNSISNPKDQVGLVSYNSFYHSHSGLSSDKKKLENLLDQIKKPKGQEVYTEIYGSLVQAAEEFRTVRGRKALLILSDGENSPYFQNTKKEHPVFGKEAVSYQTPIEFLQKEGISVYVIHFGTDAKDQHLSKIATQTGGVTFNAGGQQELESVYNKIVDQILNEVVLIYPATMDPGDKKFVRVDYQNKEQKHSVTRFYLSGTVFGNPLDQVAPWVWVLFPLALIGLWGLSRIRFEKQRLQPSIEILNRGQGKASTNVLTLAGEKTMIGGSPQADLTIAGLTGIKQNHATILFDSKENQYTLMGEENIMVNNKKVKEKKLEPGDVINFDGLTMVFDEGEKDLTKV